MSLSVANVYGTVSGFSGDVFCPVDMGEREDCFGTPERLLLERMFFLKIIRVAKNRQKISTIAPGI
ncbi:MAG TPA: hypothetical protein PKY78_07635 [Candidatus Omnitrophota bacterium]|nr:hypothetical protein [Candidatus Omnitrophota bacterium]